jgi:hypothetical protein
LAVTEKKSNLGPARLTGVPAVAVAGAIGPFSVSIANTGCESPLTRVICAIFKSPNKWEHVVPTFIYTKRQKCCLVLV